METERDGSCKTGFHPGSAVEGRRRRICAGAERLKSVLSSKVSEDKLIVVDSLDFEAPKTKKMKEVLANLKADKALVVVDGDSKNTILSVRNLPTARGVYSNSISVYDILKYDTVVVTKSAVKAIEEVYA